MLNNINSSLSRVMISLLFLFILSVVQAGAAPLWTLVPAPGSQTTQTVPVNGTATIQYIVQNQSNRAKDLVILPMPGVVQSGPCLLAPKGQLGSSCILTLAITGRALPANGVHDGPILCQVRSDRNPDSNQCYRPSRSNTLNITRGSATTNANIISNTFVLSFSAGGSASVTITNSISSSQSADNILANIPGGSAITIQNNTCGASLSAGASCTITFTSPSAEGPTNVTISGTNTNTIPVMITVIMPTATISVTPLSLSFVQSGTGNVTVTNDVSSPVAATNVIATIPGGSGISVQSTTCGASLAIGASCTITFTAPSPEGPTVIPVNGSNTNTVNVDVTVTATPTATISVSPPSLSFVENLTGDITVTNDPASPVAAANVTATIPGGSGITVQSTTCGASLAIGASCTITLTAPAAESLISISVSGTNTNLVYVDVTVTPAPTATITLSPLTLAFAVNATGDVTVTNDVSSTVAAANVAATIPGGTSITVQNTTCGASLAIGASCTITFTASTIEGPTSIPIEGTNTNMVTVDVTVTNQPQISVTAPVQQSRIVVLSGGTLQLEITNDAGSAVNANGISVTNQAGCPALVVDDSACASVAPGASCLLELSSTTPYVPCTLTINGTNTNNVNALIAFFHLGGLVFEESGGSGKIVIDASQEFTSSWAQGGPSIIPGASSLSDGEANTNAIVAHTDCSSDPTNCAAQNCRTINAVWYLPARDEMSAVWNALCPNSVIPCNFGDFQPLFYWSSSEQSEFTAWATSFPSNVFNPDGKSVPDPVRCIRTF